MRQSKRFWVALLMCGVILAGLGTGCSTPCVPCPRLPELLSPPPVKVTCDADRCSFNRMDFETLTLWMVWYMSLFGSQTTGGQ